MEEYFLPVLSHFQNGNIWTGSDRRLRYRLVPGEEVISAALRMQRARPLNTASAS